MSPRPLAVPLVILALLLASPGWSQPAAHSADAPVSKPASPSLDFDLLGESHHAEAPTPAATADLSSEVARRRHMLQLHQGLGFLTIALLATTDVLGQLNLDDRYGGGGVTNQFDLIHIAFATATLAAFMTVGALGLFAPTPYAKPLKFDTALVHKMFMTVATLGMLAQVGLGILASAHEGSLSQKDFVFWHQLSGYGSLGAMACGATVLLF